jgi:hypothetical protein
MQLRLIAKPSHLLFVRGRFLVALVGRWDLLPYAKHLFFEANRTGMAPEGTPKPNSGAALGRDGEKLELCPLSLRGFPKNFVDEAIHHTPVAPTDQTDGAASRTLFTARLPVGD